MKTAKRPRGVGNLSKAPNPLSKAFPRCDHSPKVYPNSSRAQMGLSCRFTSHNQTDVLNFQSFHYLIVFPSFLSFHLFSIFFPSFFRLFFRLLYSAAFAYYLSRRFLFPPLSFALLPCVLLHRISSVLLLQSPPLPVVLRHVLISPCSSPFLLSFTCETVDPSRWPICVQSAVSKTAVAFCAQLAAGPKGLGRAQTTSDVGDPKAAQTSREGAG